MQVIDLLSKEGLDELYPPQQHAIEAGVLDGKNLVLAVPPPAAKHWWLSSAFYNTFSNTVGKRSTWPRSALWLARNSRNSKETQQSRNLTGTMSEPEYPLVTMTAQTRG